MRLTKRESFLVVVLSAFGTMLILIGLMGMTPARAQGLDISKSKSLVQPPPPSDDDLVFIAWFTDELSLVTDLSGTAIGEGVHGGEASCYRDTCSQTTHLIYTIPLTDPYSIEYKFVSRQSLDPDAERAIVHGTGAISSRGQREEFSFTATFQNNRDGTVWVKYEASRPDASFIIPKSPGTFTISRSQ